MPCFIMWLMAILMVIVMVLVIIWEMFHGRTVVWATKICLPTSKISKLCVFGRPISWVTSWKANFENYSRYSLIKWYQFLSIWLLINIYSMSDTSFHFMPHHARASCLIIGLTINTITVLSAFKSHSVGYQSNQKLLHHYQH